MTWNQDDPTRTLDRVEVVPGLCIWNYNLDLDMVIAFDHKSHGQNWWRTERGVFDAQRMWVRHPVTGVRADNPRYQPDNVEVIFPCPGHGREAGTAVRFTDGFVYCSTEGGL